MERRHLCCHHHILQCYCFTHDIILSTQTIPLRTLSTIPHIFYNFFPYLNSKTEKVETKGRLKTCPSPLTLHFLTCKILKHGSSLLGFRVRRVNRHTISQTLPGGTMQQGTAFRSTISHSSSFSPDLNENISLGENERYCLGEDVIVMISGVFLGWRIVST